MDEIKIHTEYIKLSQLLKLWGEASQGAEAKNWIKDGKISVNGQVCLLCGKKLYPNDRVSCNDKEVMVKNNED